MATVVVCDDDNVLRSAVSALCEDAGLHVVAETDSGADAAELVRRFHVDVLVLDLSLVDGSGEVTLRSLEHAVHKPAVIVFTAYASAPDHLIRQGAQVVVEKPDTDRLSEVLRDTIKGLELDDSRGERRGLARSVDASPELWRSPSGICAAQDIIRTGAVVEPGDAVLVVASPPTTSAPEGVGELLVTDLRLAPGRLLRQTLRVQDVVHELPEIDGFVAILRGGEASGPVSAWERLVRLLRDGGITGPLLGAWRTIDGLGVTPAIDRAVESLRAARPDDPDLLAG